MDKKQMTTLIEGMIESIVTAGEQAGTPVDEKTVRGLLGNQIRRRKAEMLTEMRRSLGLDDQTEG